MTTLTSVSSNWAAEAVPEIYPPGAAKESYDEERAAQEKIARILAAAPADLTPHAQAKLLKKNGFCSGVSEHFGVYVFLASLTAPELDVYIYIDRQKE